MTRSPWSLLIIVALFALLPVGVLAQEAETAPEVPPPPEVPQPAYEGLRIDDGGFGRAYRVWEEWVPALVTMPDGGAWAFFTAQAKTTDGYGERQLYATHFDPTLAVWLPARSLGAGSTQFGASAVVDSKGVVHLVYSERTAESDQPASTLIYRRFVDGAWSDPTPVAPDPNAGYQMLASLTVDHADGLHVIWRDQRFVAPEARASLPTNADLVASDLVDGEWTAPVQINVREAPEVNPAWPHLVADGDRLVAVWSIYRGTTAEEMKSATRVEWSTKSLAPDATWSAPQTLYVREGGEAGGRLIDLAADPRGGAVVVYGLYNRGSNNLFLQRLDSGATAWSAPALLAAGDFGYLPAIAIAGDGAIYAVFNNGRNRDIDIGGLVADASGSATGAVTLTPGEGGITARASVALDRNGVPWVAYMRQPAGASNVTEIQVVRAATFIPPSPS